MKIWRYYPLIFLALIVLLYGNTLFNGLVHDAIPAIQDNPYIKDIKYIDRVLLGCIDEYFLLDCRAYGYYYRPLSTLTLLVVSFISTHPATYHFFSLILLGVFAFVLKYFFTIVFKSSKLAIVATILFLLHPAISQVVNGAENFHEILIGIYILLTLIFYYRYRYHKKKFFLLASIAVYTAALFTKETALFSIPLLPVFVYLFVPKTKYKHLLWYIIPICLYLSMRIFVLGELTYTQPDYYSFTPISYVFNIISLFGDYMESVIFPFFLNAAPRFYFTSFNDPRLIFGLASLILFVFLLFIAYKKKNKTVLFGLSFFVLSIIPSLIFFSKLGKFGFAERYLFIPLIGITIVASYYLHLFYNRPQTNKTLLYLVVTFIVFISVAYTIHHNSTWKNNTSYSQELIRADKNNPEGYYLLGIDYKKNNKINEAREQFQKTVLLDPTFEQAKLQLQSLNYREYKSRLLSFIYNAELKLESVEPKIVLLQPDKKKILIETISLSEIKSYTNAVPGLTLVNKGPALIPNFNKSTVEVWQNDSASHLRFFLPKENKVIVVDAQMGENTQMYIDQIFLTLKVKN